MSRDRERDRDRDRGRDLVPDAGNLPSSYDEELRARAIRELKRKAEFRQNVISYAVVNAFLVAIWAFSGGGYFWPIWPILGWGIGVVFHGVSLSWGDAPSGDQVEAEAQRLRRRDEARGITGASGAGASTTGGALGSAAPGVGGTPPVSPAPQPGPWDRSPGPQDAD